MHIKQHLLINQGDSHQYPFHHLLLVFTFFSLFVVSASRIHPHRRHCMTVNYHLGVVYHRGINCHHFDRHPVFIFSSVFI